MNADLVAGFKVRYKGALQYLETKTGHSERDLSIAAGLSDSTTNKWGRNMKSFPNVGIVKKWCDTHGISLIWLIEGSGTMLDAVPTRIPLIKLGILETEWEEFLSSAVMYSHSADWCTYIADEGDRLVEIEVSDRLLSPRVAVGSSLIAALNSEYRGPGYYLLLHGKELTVRHCQIGTTVRVSLPSEDFQTEELATLDFERSYQLLGKVVLHLDRW